MPDTQTNIEQKHSSFEFEIKQEGDEARIEGFASTFGNIDSMGDIIKPGAFKKSLGKRTRRVKMLWQHDSRQPIGVFDKLKEEEKGLFVSGKFANTTKAQEARELALMGAVDYFSIGYSVANSDVNKKGNRILKEIDLFEVSLVTFPANEKAKIVTVKSLPENIRDFEEHLRDVGFSQREAKTIASNGFKALDEQRDVEESDQLKELNTKLENLINTIRG